MTLHDYARVLVRRKWFVILFVVLVPAVALLVSLGRNDVFSASADVLITNQSAAVLLGLPDTGQSSPSAERFAQTQASIARTPALARQTLRAARVSGETARSFLERSSVSTRPNEDLLQFVVQDRTAKQAIALATEYARQFPIYRRELDGRALARTRAEVQQQLDSLETQGQRGSVLYKTLADKREQLSAIEALQTTSAQLLRPADQATQIAPRPQRALILGIMLGLFVGVAFAFAWDALDTRLRSPEDIAAGLKLPLLARLPAPPKNLRKYEGLVSLEDPWSAGSEAFRILRTNIEFVTLGIDARTILVTSAGAAEGKSTTAANLAVSLAQSGKSVVVIDCDLRRPALADLFNLSSSKGLTDLALRRFGIEQVTQTVGLEGSNDASGTNGKRVESRESRSPGVVSVIPAGPLPPNPGEFVGSSAVAEVIAKLRGLYDVVLIDTPPMLQVGDAISLSRHVDAILLVVRLNVARKPSVTEMRRVLDTCPASELGVVVTDTHREDMAYLGYPEYPIGKRAPKPSGARL